MQHKPEYHNDPHNVNELKLNQYFSKSIMESKDTKVTATQAERNKIIIFKKPEGNKLSNGSENA